MPKARRNDPKNKAALVNISAAWQTIWEHPLFAPLLWRRTPESPYHPDLSVGWAVVYRSGSVTANESRLAEPGEWVYIFTHCLLHLGFDHFNPPPEATAEVFSKAT